MIPLVGERSVNERGSKVGSWGFPLLNLRPASPITGLDIRPSGAMQTPTMESIDPSLSSKTTLAGTGGSGAGPIPASGTGSKILGQ